MPTEADLQNIIQDLKSDVSNLGIRIASQIQDLESQITVAGPVSPVAMVNQSSVVDDATCEAITAALQVQVDRDVAPAWGVRGKLTFYPTGATVPTDAWQIVFLDNSDQANALGYHDYTSGGLPLGKVFAKSDQVNGASVSVTASHEVLEMLVDPAVATVALLNFTDGTNSITAVEVGDPVEADNLGYTIDNIAVSDFAYPQWFQIYPGTQYDHMGHCTSAGQILPGGYISRWVNGAWVQINGHQRINDPTALAQLGSRRERRSRPKDQWIFSTHP